MEQDLLVALQQVTEPVLPVKKEDAKTRWLFSIIVGFSWSLIGILFLASFNQPLKSIVFSFYKEHSDTKPLEQKEEEKLKKELSQSINKSNATLKKVYPKEPFLIINTTENTFSLKNGEQVIREGICSTGSYVLLNAEDKQWLFKTPRGVRKVLGKVRNPIWRKPDWAFVEEGLPIPSASSELRYEYGVLGNYAMALGQGYMIHGTLYKRQLGMPVTHGCIRLADDDLETVFNSLRVGSRVYIY